MCKKSENKITITMYIGRFEIHVEKKIVENCKQVISGSNIMELCTYL